MGAKAQRQADRKRADREAKRHRGKYGRRLAKDLGAARARSKYGPRGGPAPVVTRSLETGEVIPPQPQRRPKPMYSPLLEHAAQRAGYESYDSYLLSDHWRELREAVLRRDGYRCGCGQARGLVVHHRRYRLGREELDDLVTLCHGCHRKEHGRLR